MIIEKVVGQYIASQGYVVGCEREGKAIIIDTPIKSYPIFIERIAHLKVEIVGIFITHSHLDHVADARPLKEFFDAPLYVHELDQGNLIVPASDGVEKYLGYEGSKLYGIQPTLPDFLLHGGEELSVGSFKFSVIHTPGHSPGSISFYFEKEKALFTGDVLMKGTFGRTDLPTGDREEIKKTLRRLATLPDDVVIYAGHLGKTTIAQEKEWICRL